MCPNKLNLQISTKNIYYRIKYLLKVKKLSDDDDAVIHLIIGNLLHSREEFLRLLIVGLIAFSNMHSPVLLITLSISLLKFN